MTMSIFHSLFRGCGLLAIVLCVSLIIGTTSPALAIDQVKIDNRLKDSTEVLQQIINIPEGGIPTYLLKNCEALVVIPGVLTGAFMVGGRHGKGIMVHRFTNGKWSNPCFVAITGGSFGLQIGGQAVDLVLIVRNRKGFDSILGDNFTLSGDATVTAGPVGRNAEAGTDLALQAEVLSYSRSKGLFAGISIKGAVLNIDNKANISFYHKLIDKRKILFDEAMAYPPAVQPLITVLQPYAGKKQ